jgi:aspartyl-tRNA(Asn)/glutamyl-tRNA(Gln) amidotransferase subunit A
MYLNDMNTVSPNLTGVPAFSVPRGLNSDGLPIGLQLIGNFWSEPLLFNLARTYEQAHPLNAHPSVFAAS